jgi:hypothetical protein
VVLLFVHMTCVKSEYQFWIQIPGLKLVKEIQNKTKEKKEPNLTGHAASFSAHASEQPDHPSIGYVD